MEYLKNELEELKKLKIKCLECEDEEKKIIMENNFTRRQVRLMKDLENMKRIEAHNKIIYNEMFIEAFSIGLR